MSITESEFLGIQPGNRIVAGEVALTVTAEPDWAIFRRCKCVDKDGNSITVWFYENKIVVGHPFSEEKSALVNAHLER